MAVYSALEKERKNKIKKKKKKKRKKDSCNQGTVPDHLTQLDLDRQPFFQYSLTANLPGLKKCTLHLALPWKCRRMEADYRPSCRLELLSFFDSFGDVE